ncbi:MAG TPA: hypothetical protein VN408_14545, partial [Actinoplanes sp.]|nr:hypothetical protein [Actinoplanes sp.]
GPENARDLYVRVTPRGVAQVGPPLPDLSPGSLKAGQDAWFSQHLAVVGAQRSWSGKSALLDTVVRESAVFAGEGRAVVVIDGDSLTRVGAGLVRDDPEAAPDPARDSIELTTLGALIRQLRGDADGEDDGPVVVSTGAPGALTELLSDLGVPLIVRVPSGLDQVWQVRDPSGTVLHEANELGSEHFVRAPKSNTAVEADPDALRELEEWTRASSWTDAEQHLSSNLDVLLGDEVADALQVLLEADGQNRELGAYEVVLDLARDADGLGTPAQQALAPAAETVGAGDGGAERPAPEGPLSPVFALRYLERKATYEQRGAWNDQLLGLLYQGRLTAAQTVALARGVLAPEGSTTGPDRALTNARVFHGVGVVLEQTPEQAARGESDEAYRRALQLVEDCVVVPDDRWKFILRLNRLTQRLTRHGLPGRFDAEQAAGHIANLRLLTEKFSNC